MKIFIQYSMFLSTSMKLCVFLYYFFEEEKKEVKHYARPTVAQARRKTFKNYFVNKQQQIDILVVSHAPNDSHTNNQLYYNDTCQN